MQQLAAQEQKTIESEFSRIASRFSMLIERLFSVNNSITDKVNSLYHMPSETQMVKTQADNLDLNLFVNKINAKMDDLSTEISRLERIDKHLSEII